MKFFIRHHGKEYIVRVESRDNEWHVKFGDEPDEVVDLLFQGNDCTFLQNENVFYANVVGDKGDVTVWRPEGSLSFRIESEYRRIVGVLRGQDIGSENQVFSKMPGKIVKVLVKEGSVVEQGAPLLVMEAMKMENEIRAPKAGHITQLSVKEGQAVEMGCLLLEIDSE